MQSIISDGSARRAAKRAGFVARKSPRRQDDIDNFGGFQVVDPERNFVIFGPRYDLSAEDVVEFCKGLS